MRDSPQGGCRPGAGGDVRRTLYSYAMIAAMPNSTPKMPASLNLRMPLGEFEAVNDTADQLGVSVSYVARRAIALGLDAAHREIADAIEADQLGSRITSR